MPDFFSGIIALKDFLSSMQFKWICFYSKDNFLWSREGKRLRALNLLKHRFLWLINLNSVWSLFFKAGLADSLKAGKFYLVSKDKHYPDIKNWGNEQPWYSTSREQKTAGAWGWLFKKIVHTFCQLKYFTSILVECLEESSLLSSAPQPHLGKASSQRYWGCVLLKLRTGCRNLFVNEASGSLLGSIEHWQGCDNPMPKLYVGKTGLYFSKGENGNWVIPNFQGQWSESYFNSHQNNSSLSSSSMWNFKQFNLSVLKGSVPAHFEH